MVCASKGARERYHDDSIRNQPYFKPCVCIFLCLSVVVVVLFFFGWLVGFCASEFVTVPLEPNPGETRPSWCTEKEDEGRRMARFVGGKTQDGKDRMERKNEDAGEDN